MTADGKVNPVSPTSEEPVTATTFPVIEPASVEWAYPEMDTDYRAGRNVWREVTEDFLDQALNVLPPMDWNGQAFLVMEPLTHIDGDAIHAGFVTINGRCFARNVPRRQFRALLAELRTVVSA